MKYNTIEIKRKISGGYYIVDCELPHDRVTGVGQLMPGLGFFHYPRKIGKEKAFKMLKDGMIELINSEIKRLQDNVNYLNELKIDYD